MPPLPPFALERFFARHEFSVRRLLCASDVEPLPMGELLALADAEGAALWRDLRLGYTESAGHPLLRAEIASLYETIAPEQVLCFAGAEEAIYILMRALLAPGDHAVVTWPAYQSLHEVARSAGADVDLLELRAEDGWAFDLEALRRRLRPTTRLVVVNFPHNPTGTRPDEATFRALAALADEAGCWVLSDEVYRGLEHDGRPPLPPMADLTRRGVSLGVMSKAFALAGLRVGWVAARDAALLERLAAYKDYTTICNAAPSELLALIALRARDRVLARSRAITAANLARCDRFFAEWSDRFAWVRPSAGSTGFPRLATDVPIDRLAERAIEEEGVLILPGTLFGHRGNHFRLGFGRADLPDALAAFERVAVRHLR